ncbi:MAG: hypothetical protein JSW40_04625, partial [Candidatus Omnitrophota bacterium]
MKRILFRADADHTIGTGDLLSLLYLSEYFKGWHTYWVTRKTVLAERILRRHRIRRVKFIPRNASPHEELAVINKFIQQNNIGVFCLEITKGKCGFYKNVRAPVKVCVDFNGKAPSGLDFVINWDIGNKNLYTHKRSIGTRFLIGPEYVALKQDILKQANALRSPRR